MQDPLKDIFLMITLPNDTDGLKSIIEEFINNLNQYFPRLFTSPPSFTPKNIDDILKKFKTGQVTNSVLSHDHLNSIIRGFLSDDSKLKLSSLTIHPHNYFPRPK